MKFWTPDINMNLKPTGTKSSERFACKKSLIGKSLPEVPITVSTTLKSCEYQGFEDGNTCTDIHCIHKHANKNPEEKPHGCKQSLKSYSDLPEGSSTEEEFFVLEQDMEAFSTANYSQIGERNPVK